MDDINWQNLNSNTMQALRYACQQLNLIQGKNKRELIATLNAYRQLHPEVSGSNLLPNPEPIYRSPVNLSPLRQNQPVSSPTSTPKVPFQLPLITQQHSEYRQKKHFPIEPSPSPPYPQREEQSPVWHPSSSSNSPANHKQIAKQQKKRTNFQLFTIFLTIIAIIFVLYLLIFH